MCHDRNSRFGQEPDGVGALRTALELDSVCTCLHQADCVCKGVGGGGLVTAKGEVRDDESTFTCPGNGRSSTFHVLNSDWKSRGIAQNNITQRISDQDHIDPGLIKN